MSDQATFQAVGAGETTGRYIVTFREGAQEEGLRMLDSAAGVRQLAMAADFELSALDVGQAESAGGAVLNELGIAVMSCPPEAAMAASAAAGQDSAIESVEPERIMYALQGDQDPGSVELSLEFLRGYCEGLRGLYDKLSQGEEGSAAAAAAAARRCFDDSDIATWGLQATIALASKYSGRGINVAVLDTGFDMQHPDFVGRGVTGQSFITGEAVDDKNGHGTHCIGTACGSADPISVRRYGVAYNARIFAGKVLSNRGSGSDIGILSGINWAVSNGCQVISMSLGADVRTTSPAYERAGQRSLKAGSLIVAAAGNNANRRFGNNGFVGRPANSKSIMAIAAVDRCLKIANFSAASADLAGGEVDIAGPGVDVFSSWPTDVAQHRPGLPNGYDIISGTSMATPHVSGIAALFAEAFQARGHQLWQLLTSHARRLKLPSSDVGSGLVISP